MIYLIYGSDIAKSIDKSNKLIETMLKKRPNASVFKMTTDRWNIAEFQELIGGQGLFENKYIVHISRIVENEEIKETIISFLKEIKESDNIFIWTEEEIDSKTIKHVEKFVEKAEENKLKESFKKPKFNIFSLGDAVGNRDKKRMWILYREALNYFSVEEIYGTIFWQIKSMMLVSKSKNMDESGLKPFVYSKSKGFLKNYSDDELKSLLLNLISVSHESRRGIHDFEIALERLILKV